MRKLAEAGKDFWRGALGAGGFTALPRWTRDPGSGVATHGTTIPDDLVTTLRRLGDELGMPLGSVLLAAHAKVLGALCGEQEVTTGYVPGDGATPLPCQVRVTSGSWRTLLLNAHKATSDLRAYKDFLSDDLRHELDTGRPLFETVFDLTGGTTLFENTVLCVEIVYEDDRLVLRLRYSTAVLDADSAARVTGYHLTALNLMATDPDAEHRRQSLLSAEELRFQIDGLAGPRRELPNRRFHELFEQQVRERPDAVAAVHGDRRWTYRELNARANRVARALFARGLPREGVVAVVTERNLDWMAAVLGVFKAGGVYLPIEPLLPADRVVTMLSRADCGLVLTEADIETTLEAALGSLPGVRVLTVDTAYAEEHTEEDLGIRMPANQLAYIYFTSGSTGEPKGATCEHAGMLNHLFAKIDDLKLDEGQVVAQTAPQCFDISLWQLLSALLVGGETLIVEQEVILDARRFVDKIDEGRVTVLQVVPSYLDVVLSALERHPRGLPDLRYVSVTGEALKKELTQRWFAAMPHVPLVNAYGLTETSDDTNHEVLERVPDSERVPLGRPIANVRVYVVDEYLAPVPLGAPGEIVFSGICVGRGYVNDPERTSRAFLTDPYREGERLYRSGDHGRWRPDGKLEFLGRRDTQIKISGFRVEIGEIENTLVRVPGVRDAAVVAAERADRGRHLVAFYAGRQPLAAGLLRERLARSLPKYMIPSAFHWRENLPLTPNSKVDRRALTTVAAELDTVATGYQAPSTPTERRLVDAWSRVLGIPGDQIGRRDHFFDRGGTSLSAVKLVIALNRAASLSDLTRYPVLAELAERIDGRSRRRPGPLHALSDVDDGRTGALVCFPYAGGNAVNFRPMAKALRGSGLAVYAVELPGHDLAAESEPFAPLDEVVERVVAEISRLAPARLLLWGHSSGSAFAAETARRLQVRGVDVQRTFVGAQLLGSAAERRAAITDLAECSDADIAAALSVDIGYAELGELYAQRATHVGAAYRHDYVSAHTYFAELLDNPPEVKLSSPISVVVASDDPHTAEASHKHLGWRLLSDHVDLHTLADGGHYFPRTRPTEAAQAVLRAADLSASS